MHAFSSMVAGQKTRGGAQLPVANPWNGESVGTVELATSQIVEQALKAGQRAEKIAAHMPAHQRIAILQGLAERMRAHGPELAELMQREAGKPIALARAEVQRAHDTFTFASQVVAQGNELLDLGQAQPAQGRYGLVRRFPLGLLTAITPFNFPLNLVAHKLAPAIAAGCPLIIKPSPNAPLTAFRLAELALDAGLPAECLSVILPDLQDMQPLLTDPRVKIVSFTGSAAVGWQLKSLAAHKKVLLELGGNAAVVVCKDADLDQAVNRTLSGGFAYAGQSCISVQRVLLAREIAQEFTELLLRRLPEKVPVGDPAEEKNVCGPVINELAAERLTAWLTEARVLGAKMLVEGKRHNLLLEPSVLENVPDHAKLGHEEAFGPLICLETFEKVETALQRVNQSRYGLQAGIFTQDIRVIWQALETLQVGGLIHNDVPTFRVDQMPYGGVKDSGLGREGPRYAVEDFTEPRLLVLKPD